MNNQPTSPGRSLIIKGLCPGLTERGKIKIGRKGQLKTSNQGRQFQAPEKLDHFIITTMQRGNDGNFMPDDLIMRRVSEQTNQPADSLKSIPARLLYDAPELNFQCRYACFNGKTLWCSGDGEYAGRLNAQNQRETVSCPCGRQDPNYQGQDKCKINGCLSVMIDGVDVVGGVWKLRTTSYNTVVGILSSLALIQRISGGPLAGLPLSLTLNPKTVVAPNNGAVQTVYIVGLEYRGSVQQLQDVGYKIALGNAQHHVRIEHIETEARKLLTSELPADEIGDMVDELYPEQAAAAAGADYVQPGAPPALMPPQSQKTESPAVAPATPPPLSGPAGAEPAKKRGRPARETTPPPATEPPEQQQVSDAEFVDENGPPGNDAPPHVEEPPPAKKKSLDLF